MNTVADLDPIAIEDGASDYRAVSGLAVLAFLVGGSSSLVLNDVAFCFIPLVGIAVSWRALRRIRELHPALSGRPLALGGLALSLIFGLSAPLVSVGREQTNRAQAIEAARGWFEALRDNRPDVAHQWMLPRWMRVKEGESIPSQYANHSGKQVMARFLQQPLVRALLNLGNRAHVRYVRHIESRSKDDEDRVFIDAYAVTVELEHETVSFFVQVKATARLDKLTKQWSWEVSECKFLPGPPDDGPASAEAAV